MDTKKKAFIIALLRRGTYKWRPRNETLSEARVERGRYKCAGCGDIVGRKEIQVDHIDPIIDPAVGWTNFDTYIDRMFCDKSGLQALCKDKCHTAKTNGEKQIAKDRRRKTKSTEGKK